ncbi:MAG: hypothetical protein DRP84_12350 [Spirochaetes bacterium]|nr:MAG: hypothetical protein DRP84_12350 [Spirochaetota bacterium]
MYTLLFFAIQFFINTVIFDIKDIKGDRLKSIKTLPNTFGIEKTKLICNAASVTSIIFIFLGIIYRLLPIYTLTVLLPFAFYVITYTYYSHKNKNTFFYGLFVDGEFIFLLFIFFISRLLNII